MVPRFRAFLIEAKTMRDVVGIDFVRNMYCLQVGRATIGEWFWYRDLELMQSTGLKDKNGIEIFEGDIVSVRNHPFQKTEKSGAGIEIDGDYAISWNEGDLTWCAGNLLLARLKPYVTVAGNVWENPELLDQSHES
ncbi:YopX family protein [Enterococcus casseliflavus]|uniref:YopX family protein n=1 Tax=Enterococcus casseliflavus TaxID=37734 RepID=UPI001CBBC9AD|nr:YopX family protein [Enterococcus casseliflavus]